MFAQFLHCTPMFNVGGIKIVDFKKHIIHPASIKDSVITGRLKETQNKDIFIIFWHTIGRYVTNSTKPQTNWNICFYLALAENSVTLQV